jgi:hypothetical protein
MRVTSMLLLTMAAALVPRRADACAGNAAPPVIYPKGDIIPTNSHFWIFVQESTVPGKNKIVPPGERRVLIQEYNGGIVQVSRNDVQSGNVHVAEIIPVAPLKPRTLYDVTLEASGRQEAERKTFETADGPDVTAPVWAGISAVSVKRTSHAEAETCNRCPDPGEPWIEIDLKRPTDDTTPEAEILYAAWLSDKHGQLDESKPPTTYLRRLPLGHLVLGVNDACMGAPEESELQSFKLPFKAILRPVDWAGHMGPPHEVRAVLK